MLEWFKIYFIDIAFYKGPIVILDTPFNEPSLMTQLKTYNPIALNPPPAHKEHINAILY